MTTDQTANIRAPALRLFAKQLGECQSSKYWIDQINDQSHFETWLKFSEDSTISYVHVEQSRLKYKTLYDSYLWKIALEQLSAERPIETVLELLPGRSFTLPIALASLGFTGVFDQVDREKTISINQNLVKYSSNWLPKDLLANQDCERQYDMVVGNHVIDDLAFSALMGPIEAGEYSVFADPDYLDPTRSALVWRRAIGKIKWLTHLVHGILVGLLNNLTLGAVLILREYPSSFALRNGDFTSVKVHLQIYQDVVRMVSQDSRFDARFLKIADDHCLPAALRFKNSFVAITRLR